MSDRRLAFVAKINFGGYVKDLSAETCFAYMSLHDTNALISTRVGLKLCQRPIPVDGLVSALRSRTNMPYEPGMQIIFDVVGKRATIIFRGHLFDLPGPFSSHSEAVLAGERRCRELGWLDLANDNLIEAGHLQPPDEAPSP